MKLSIITPMYNSYVHMGRYFESLEKQTSKNFEVIIIDDKSNDDSYQKVMEYKTKSNLDIKLLKTESNKGPGLARNLGLKHLTGNHLTFIDSDDYIDHNFIKEIENQVKEKKIDCLIFDFYRENKRSKNTGTSIPGHSEGIISKKEAISNSTGSTCCKVYKSEIIKENQLSFPDLMRFEDMVFNKLSISKCNSIYYIKKHIYYYVDNDESIVNDKQNNNEKFVVEAFKILENKLSEEFNEEIETIFIRELLYSSVLTMISRGLDKKTIKTHIKTWVEKYPEWYRNKNINNFSLHQKVALKFIKYNFIIGLRLLSYLRNRKLK